MQKIDTNVEYPLILDLKEFLPEISENASIYDLYAVNIHIGTVSEGHYIVYARVDDEWYCFDDAIIE